jgi:hypothetical protein
MRLSVLAVLLCALAAAATPGDVLQSVRAGIAAHRTDSEIAALVREVSLTERLEDAAVEQLQSEGAGPLTVEELERQRDLSETLPRSAATLIDSPVAPTAEEQSRLIGQVREIAAQYTAGLPNFLCTQIIRRYAEKKGSEAWQPRDVLLVDVAYTGKSEQYKLVSINGQPSTKTLNNVGGYKSTGEFGSLLRFIFSPRAQAEFHWERWSNLRGRPTHVLAFHILQEHSEYRLNFRALFKTYRMIAGVHGLIYVDRETHKVMRIRTESEGLPASWPIRRTPSVLDYDFAEVGGQEYLLPRRVDSRVITKDGQSRNVMEFGNYRRFAGQSTVTFEKQSAAARAEAAFASTRVRQCAFDPLHRLVARDDQLRDAIAGVDRVRLAAEVHQDDPNLAAVARVDGAGRVRHRDRVLERQAATRPHLSFKAGRQLNRQAGGHKPRELRLQDGVLDGAEVHSRVLVRSMGIGGKNGGGIGALNADLHFVMIAS